MDNCKNPTEETSLLVEGGEEKQIDSPDSADSKTRVSTKTLTECASLLMAVY